MKTEYYHNGSLKHNIGYYDNGNKCYERFFDENGKSHQEIGYYDNGTIHYEQFYDEDGEYHRENGLPDYQHWLINGKLKHKTFYYHGKRHNIYNPANIKFHFNVKIWWKAYCLNDDKLMKLEWQNQIKNI